MEKLAIVFVLLIFGSCGSEKEKISLSAIQNLSSGKVLSEGTFLADGLGYEKFLCWTEEGSEGNVLVFRRFSHNKFEDKITVTPTLGLQSHHESMAKIGVTSEGVLFCLFRVSAPTAQNKYGGALYYTISKDAGKTWSEKVKLVTELSSTSQSFYDLERVETGALAMVWLDNRFSTREKRGSTLFYTSTLDGTSVEKERPIAFNTCQCCRTDLSIANGEIKIAFRNIIEENIRDMFYITSSDHGINFTKPERISEDKWEIDGCPHTGPSLASGKNTGVAWFTAGQGNKGLFFATREKGKNSFEERIEISENGNHPQLINAKGIYYVVYDEYYTKDDTTHQHIKLLKKNTFAPDEIIELTSEGTMNTHPVITKLTEDTLLVSWTNLDANKKIIQSIIIKI